MATTGAGNSTWIDMFGWTYLGVDFTLPGNGGRECVDFLSPRQRLLESLVASLFAAFIVWLAYPRLTLPATEPKVLTEKETSGKRLLLVLMCLTWGCELGFKFATRQMIWIFNPCHIATAVQIYLLAAPPSKAVAAAFRLHMHMLTGAPIAILFPVVNTRLLPFETEVYYIQHMLMLVIPFYLMHLGDPYIPERLSDFSWAATTFGLLFIYHFFPLQLLAMATQVNLNNMLCPAVSDPFHGPYYRLFAIAHQVLLIPSLGKIYAALARRLGWCPFEPESSVADLIKEEMSARDAASSDFGVNAAGGGQSANSSPHSRGDSHGEEKNRVHRYTDKGKHSPGNSNCSAAHNKMNGGARSEDGYLMQQSGGDVAHTANGHLKKQ
ncbi:hypothetical protein BaRGS_00019424 [Batillaria attramentaria]|uniref:Transmembrane protein 164 n=1 Tax=Batillaria attramentaria TaxID=370345 RepID=A0ABD0KQG2_9CAEN